MFVKKTRYDSLLHYVFVMIIDVLYNININSQKKILVGAVWIKIFMYGFVLASDN